MTVADSEDTASFTERQFATWARVRRVRLPYPIDLAQVDGSRAPLAADGPMLQHLAAVCASPRVAVFVVHHVPVAADGAVVRQQVAVADTGSRAVAIAVSDERVELRRIADTELVQSLGGALGGPTPLAGATWQTDEAVWGRLTDAAAHETRPERLAQIFADAQVPTPLARAIVSSSGRPVPSALLGAATWPDGTLALGRHVATWLEFRAGAVLVDRPVTGRGGPAAMTITPYSHESAARLLATITADALRETGGRPVG